MNNSPESVEAQPAKQARPSYFYLDFLRCIAAFAVVTIHVLGPFRHLYGTIPDGEWMAGAGYNSLTRWAVPVFMMISGALLLSDKKPFDCKYYLVRRLSKVAIPFVGWSLIYALLIGFKGAGFTEGTWDLTATLAVIQKSPNDPAWYHLWFFYDFIPLYFVVPLLIPLLRVASIERVKLLLAAWFCLTLMRMMGVESFLQENIILYTGYFLFGWYLFNRDNKAELKYWVMAGSVMLLLNFSGSFIIAEMKGEYSSFFMGYKTINTAVIGGMLFVVAQCYAEAVTGKLRTIISLFAKYSLGIYLVHPLFLIPIHILDSGYYSFFGSNWIAIPMITVATLFVSLFVTMGLAKIPVLKRLVP